MSKKKQIKLRKKPPSSESTPAVHEDLERMNTQLESLKNEFENTSTFTFRLDELFDKALATVIDAERFKILNAREQKVLREYAACLAAQMHLKEEYDIDCEPKTLGRIRNELGSKNDEPNPPCSGFIGQFAM